jgi:sarcosine oxidase/L-pipecolate oxidase
MYECIVVGAGIEGSATAYTLAKGGTKGVLLLEQYEACHNRGSSCGQSRITRRAYETLFYVEMMTDAYRMWSDLEKEAGTTLYKCTGVMVFGENGDPYVQQTIKSMKIASIPHDVLSGAEINRRFPKQMKIPDDYVCVIEEDAGILYAQKALRAMQVNKYYYLHHFLPHK